MAVTRYSLSDTRLFPQLVYIGLTLGGCVYIAVAKTMGVRLGVSVSVPIVIMFTYLAISWYFGKLRLHDEQVGDNLYYMGFLFTLASLGTSLYQFGNSGSTDEIVRNFGIAITSTITGIALRIFYNQVRRDPVEVERATRFELTESTRRVRTELESVAQNLAEFRRVCNQMVEEGFHEIARQAERNGELVFQSFDSISRKSIGPLEEASSAITSTLNTSSQQIENMLKSVAQRMETVSQSFQDAESAMGATLASFEAQVASAASSVKSSGSSIAGSMGRVEKQLSGIGERLSAVGIPDEILKTEVTATLKALTGALVTFSERSDLTSREYAEGPGRILEVMARNDLQPRLLTRMDDQIRSMNEIRDLLKIAVEGGLLRNANPSHVAPPSIYRPASSVLGEATGRSADLGSSPILGSSDGQPGTSVPRSTSWSLRTPRGEPDNR